VVDLAVAGCEPRAPELPAEPPDRVPVTVVVVNYNADHVLIDCLESALREAEEVVLVDNASRPETFEPLIAGVAAHPRLRVVRVPENRGFAAGCNLGTAISTQPYVLYLNPDCNLTPGSLARLCRAVQEHPRAAMAGGRLTYPDGVEQGGGRRAVPTPWRSFVRGFGLARFARRWPKVFDDFHLHRQPLPSGPVPVEAISGACMFVTRRAIDDVGPLDEGYFLHCEDLDLCARARQRGWDILFVPDAPIVHHKGGCSRDRPVFVEWHKHKGMVRFYRKHFHRDYPGILMLVVTVGVWIRFTALVARMQTAAVLQGLGNRIGKGLGRAGASAPAVPVRHAGANDRVGGGGTAYGTAAAPMRVASRPFTT